MLHPDWRRRESLRAWLIALGFALALALPWPLLLWQRAPTLFELWRSAELASLGFRGGGGQVQIGDYDALTGLGSAPSKRPKTPMPRPTRCVAAWSVVSTASAR